MSEPRPPLPGRDRLVDVLEIEAHVASAMATLEDTALKGEQFRSMVAVYRGGRSLAVILPENGDGRVIAFAAQAAAALFRADQLIIVSDSYYRTGPDMINPMTGKEWQHGDMEDLALHHDGIAKGLVTECLMILAMKREGFEEYVIPLPYQRVDPLRTGIEWGEPIIDWKVDLALPPEQRDFKPGEKGRLSAENIFTAPADMPEVPPSITDRDAAMLLTVAGCQVTLVQHTGGSV